MRGECGAVRGDRSAVGIAGATDCVLPSPAGWPSKVILDGHNETEILSYFRD